MVIISHFNLARRIKMPQGKSGRIVIEMPQGLKKLLYAKLALSGLSLKDWFISQVEQWVLAADETYNESKKNFDNGADHNGK